MTIKEMREQLGNRKPLSKAAFARIYKIPLRTLEDWEAGKRTPPEYVLYLLERAVKYDKEHTEKSEDDVINNRFL